MIDLKHLLGAAASALSILNLSLYVRAVLGGKTRPHAFSWLIWAITMGVVFAAQYTNAAGPGAWQTGIAACACAAIGILALFRGERRITRSDWAALIGVFLALPLWAATENPLAAVLLLTLMDAVGFYPTFRKSWHAPHQESASWAFRATAVFALSTAALQNYSWTTAFYPAVMVALHAALGVMLLSAAYVHRGVKDRA